MGDRTLEELLLAEEKEEEIKLLNVVIKKDPNNIPASIKVGDLLRERGEVVKALRIHKSLIESIRKTSPLVRYKLYSSIIKDYLKLENYPQIVKLGETLAQQERNNLRLLKFLLSTYEKIGAWEEGIRLLKKNPQLKGKDWAKILALFYSFKGKKLVEEGDYKGGLKWIKEGLKIDKNCIPATIFMGEIYFKEGNLDKSIEVLKKIFTTTPEVTDIIIPKLKEMYYQKKEFHKFESLCKEGIKKQPKNLPLLLMVSEICEKKGKIELAIEVLERGYEDFKHNYQVVEKLSTLYFKKNEIKKLYKMVQELSRVTYKSKYVCSHCKKDIPQYNFKCPYCGEWLTVKLRAG